MASSPWEPRLEADRPLLERIGAKNVNALLLWLYCGFWVWGFVTLLLIPSNANQPWPLSLALAFVIVCAFARGLEIGIGATLVPGYVYYPDEPRYLFMTADGLILLCFVIVLATFIANPSSSSGPLFTTFFMLIALAIVVYKLWNLVFPNGFWATAFGTSAGAKTAPVDKRARLGQLQFPGESEYDDYAYDDYEYDKSANPAAKKLAAMLKAQRGPPNGRRGPIKK